LKPSAILITIILALSLAVWCFFDITSAPLQPAETTVVVGLCTLLVLAAKFFWSRLARPRKKNG
jgi:hypothetical protein